MHISNEHILTLQALEGFGPATVGAVAEHVSKGGFSPKDIGDLHGILEDMLAAGLIKGAAKKNFPDMDDMREAEVRARRVLDRSGELGIGMVSRYDPAFPEKLLRTVDEEGKAAVPLYLFYKGDLSTAGVKGVAVIGTREPTPEGVRAGEYIGAAFARAGFDIVSGLALGCDSAGHRGALSVQGGLTTAFLAHGLDTVYPPENAGLADDIVAAGGLLMSEYPVGTGVNRYNLVARDRLQAALADVTIVIQTDVHGGTMHAVNATFAAGKPVYAVEYARPIHSDKVKGNEYLRESRGALGLPASKVGQLVASMGAVPGATAPEPQEAPAKDGGEPVQLEFDFD